MIIGKCYRETEMDKKKYFFSLLSLIFDVIYLNARCYNGQAIFLTSDKYLLADAVSLSLSETMLLLCSALLT